MQAIILAAGMGKRLKELTENNTKCMIEVNGVKLIERMLCQLDERGFSRIIIVVGYKKNNLKDFIRSLLIKTPIVFIDNDDYYKTNNIYSLSLAKEYLMEEDSLLLESDIIFEDSVLDLILNDSRKTLALVDRYEAWMDGTCVRLDEDDRIVDFISGRKFDYNNTKDCFKTVNIYKFSADFSKKKYVPFLDAYLSALGQNEYYEQVLRVISMLEDSEIRCERLKGEKWYEIDDVQDLDIAAIIFCDNENEKLVRFEERYGGYWRFPEMLDFCYLVNPYFPPKKMLDEMRASFDILISHYPSGMSINSLLAGKMFGVRADYIAVGNGAAELIKSVISLIEGKVGFIKPTFEEYPNRYNSNNNVIYEPKNVFYSYNSDDIINYFDETDINALILINPDNPSGNYINKQNLHSIMDWSRNKGIKIIIDESFADFADEEDNTLLDNDILENYPNLFVVKSISKSYGVPGLRLGVIASSNSEKINFIKRDVSIWNINSYAEFFLQICEKYKAEYEYALMEFKKERARMRKKLEEIEMIDVIPSEANYFMLRLKCDISAKELAQRLLAEYNILIKDLSDKLDRTDYIRVAIRNKHDNDLLIKTLERIVI